jgi:acetylglutamate kinase
MPGASTAAEVVLNAIGKARSLRGRPVVVKLGGSAMEDPVAARGALECVAALQLLGVRLVLIHGGGKPIDRAMEAAGVQPVKVQGRRYTDPATLEIVVRVLGELNRGIVEQIEAFGGTAVGFHDASQFPLRGEPLALTGEDGKPVDLGRVGRVTTVTTATFTTDHSIPVLPSLAVDAAGGWLNVNADTVAAAVAGAVHAESVLFLTDTPGVLYDRNDPSSRFARLTAHQCRELTGSRVIAGGMIPKVEACLDALDAGAERTVILDGRDPHALLTAFVSSTPGGTEIVN